MEGSQNRRSTEDVAGRRDIKEPIQGDIMVPNEYVGHHEVRFSTGWPLNPDCDQ